MASKRSSKVEEKAPTDRKDDILRAAIEVFATKGYHGCRIADVAKEAGVAYGLVYHYFRNKDELLESVFSNGFGRFAHRIDKVAEGDGPVTPKIEELLSFIFDAYQADPRAVRVLVLEIARSPIFKEEGTVSVIQHALETTARLIGRGQKQGEFREDIHPFVAASALFGAVETTLTTFVLGALAAQSTEGVERARHDLLALFLAGMRPGAAREATWERKGTTKSAAS